ncbi:hypothetical protein [Cohnella luojiensis]|uniref:Sporulation membrane protein YtrI C-terminal domain-containing protein n=1 Tax=Cohnella luojiensis TaxID=652876 RepID=A0A4Y8M0T9_9BACL|nr:hypothetical protein [Cohnella luojiensis]TFE27836.1 hypothetical protein E2980_08620 [Cohnella luojiensis]
MRIPSFDRFQKFMQVTAFFVCGMVVGSAVYSALENDVVEGFILRNYQLEEQLETMRMDLKLAQQVRKENVINNIRIIFQQGTEENKIDILTETALKKKVKGDLDIFLGRSIYDINTDAVFVRKLLSTKIYDNVADKDYAVSIKTILVVDGVLQAWVEAKIHLRK